MFQSRFPEVLVLEKFGGAGDKAESVAHHREIWRKQFEVLEVVLQERKWLAEKCRGWSEAVGGSPVSRSAGVLDTV